MPFDTSSDFRLRPVAVEAPLAQTAPPRAHRKGPPTAPALDGIGFRVFVLVPAAIGAVPCRVLARGDAERPMAPSAVATSVRHAPGGEPSPMPDTDIRIVPHGWRQKTAAEAGDRLAACADLTFWRNDSTVCRNAYRIRTVTADPCRRMDAQERGHCRQSAFDMLTAKIRREEILLQYSRLLETRAVIFYLCPSTSYRRWGSSRSPRPPNSALLLPRPTPPDPNPSRRRITSWCPPIISGNLLILPNLRPRDGWQFPRKGGIGARLPCYHIPVMISPHAYSVWWSG